MATFQLLTYAKAGRPTGAVHIDGRVIDLRDATPDTPAVLDVLNVWDRASATLGALADDSGRSAALPGQVLAGLTLLPPVLYPNGIYCAGANYKDHVAEMARAFKLPPEPDPHELGMPPWCFLKTPRNTMVGHGATVTLPAHSKTVDWELEVAVVIGRTCKDVSEGRAMDYIAAYTLVNDLSARDHLRRPGVKPNSGSPMEYDWVSHKNWDGACPIGPWLVPAAAIADPMNLPLKLWVNDELMQDSNTNQLIYNYAEIISFLSHRCTLYPGDVIATGTPAGVGTPRGIFLKRGDVVRINVEGIGTLTITIA